MKIKRFAAVLILLSIALVANASSNYWIDATHMFDNELKGLSQAVRMRQGADTYNARAMAPQLRKPKRVGDIEEFWTKNIVQNKFEKTKAVLKAIGKSCYIYLEQGKNLSNETIEKIKNSFDNRVYVTDRAMFGSEASPGIDGDKRITLLLLDIKDGFNGSGGFVGGYFYAADEYLQSQIPPQYNVKSNEREMFYLDIYPSDPTSDHYMAIVAHEFQHMIHFNHDSGEYTWLNESCSQIAPYFCGFGHANQIVSYMRSPDNSLSAWSKEHMVANYGQVYLWNYYLYNRFMKHDSKTAGIFFRRLVDSKLKGIKSFSDALRRFKISFKDAFDGFCVANFVNDPKLGAANEFSYDRSLGKLHLPVTESVKSLPSTVKNTVYLWSADAIKVDLNSAKTTLNIKFKGEKRMFGERYNTFSVALVLSNSNGGIKPKIQFVKDFDFSKYVNRKGFDTLTIVVIAHGPDYIDDKAYANAVPIKYALQISDKGAKLAATARYVENYNDSVAKYANIAKSMENADNEQLSIAFTQLEDINFQITMKIKNELEDNNYASIDSVIRQAENTEVSIEYIRPLLKSVLDVAKFSGMQNADNEELNSRIQKITELMSQN